MTNETTTMPTPDTYTEPELMREMLTLSRTIDALMADRTTPAIHTLAEPIMRRYHELFDEYKTRTNA